MNNDSIVYRSIEHKREHASKPFTMRPDVVWKNTAGYVRWRNESLLYAWLEDTYLKRFYAVCPQFRIDNGCIVDYKCIDERKRIVFIEVKNWFVSVKDMEQLLKYYTHACIVLGEECFSLVCIAAGIDDIREGILNRIGIEVVLTKDLLENEYKIEQDSDKNLTS